MHVPPTAVSIHVQLQWISHSPTIPPSSLGSTTPSSCPYVTKRRGRGVVQWPASSSPYRYPRHWTNLNHQVHYNSGVRHTECAQWFSWPTVVIVMLDCLLSCNELITYFEYKYMYMCSVSCNELITYFEYKYMYMCSGHLASFIWFCDHSTQSSWSS